MKNRWKTFTPPQNNLMQDSEGNEENRYLVLDSKKTKINDTKEPTNTHKNTVKEKILKVIAEFHGDITRNGQAKHTRGTQEIPRHQK
jgi:L-lactate utilization protein LutB